MSEQADQPAAPEFSMQRIYIKDASFESPRSPDAFMEQWKPKVNLDLNSRSKSIGTDLYEVVLSLTVTVKKEDDEVVYLSEVQQAGIFLVKGLDDKTLGHMLGSFCPSVLFPYAREAIDSMVIKGSFPALMLAPVNFDAIYEKSQQQASVPVPGSETIN